MADTSNTSVDVPGVLWTARSQWRAALAITAILSANAAAVGRYFRR